MSEQTKAALEEAPQNHVSDECDDDPLVTAYILSAATTSFSADDRNTHSYYMECSDNQPAHVTRGLADIQSEWAASNSLFVREDDDE